MLSDNILERFAYLSTLAPYTTPTYPIYVYVTVAYVGYLSPR